MPPGRWHPLSAVRQADGKPPEEADAPRGLADLAPASQRGTAFGWFNLLLGAVLLPASVLFGWLWEGVSAAFAFGFSASCALLAAGLLVVWVRPHATADVRAAAKTTIRP